MPALAIDSQPEAFDLWASVYDQHPNPFIALESRFLACLLPSVKGLSVLDVGCGTGRWLKYFERQSPIRLIGVDTSRRMLAQAQLRAPTAQLYARDAASVSAVSATVDLILASFVLSYLPRLDAFAAEAARLTTSGARLFLTDLHPHTSRLLDWKRSFSIDNAHYHIDHHRYSCDEILACFERAGFCVRVLLEPAFSEPERSLFETAGKSDDFQELSRFPAIYILELEKCARATGQRTFALHGARLALGAREAVHASLVVSSSKIHSLLSHPASSAPAIDLSGYIVLPGLINAHDHLDFSPFPRLGAGPYQNATQWAEDIHERYGGQIAKYRSIPKETRIWWGIIANLLCGVTSVCHHNPLPQCLGPHALPMRIVRNFAWAHSLAFDSDAPSKFHASPGSQPFILHAAEGVDAASAREIFLLDRYGMLESRTILVHALALTPESAALVRRRGVGVVLCPSSNQFLFGRTHSLSEIARLGKVLLGSDSPLTATGDLLDELRFAQAVIGLSAGALYEMVTARSAAILQLSNGEGSLVPGGVADMIALRDDGAPPAIRLSQASAHQVELVIVAGQVQLASGAIYDRLPQWFRKGLQLLLVNGRPRWTRAPLDRLFAASATVLANGALNLAGKVVARAQHN